MCKRKINSYTRNGAQLNKHKQRANNSNSKGNRCTIFVDLSDKRQILSDFIGNKDIFIENKDIFIANKDIFIEKKDIFIERKDILIERKDILIERKDILIGNISGQNPPFRHTHFCPFDVGIAGAHTCRRLLGATTKGEDFWISLESGLLPVVVDGILGGIIFFGKRCVETWLL